jgi:hypothetical protein
VGKRVAIILVVLLVIGLAILGYYLQQGRKRLLADPYKAISPSACMVLETADLQTFLNSLTTKNGLFGEVARIKEFESFNVKLKYLSDQLTKSVYKDALEGGNALLSFYPAREGRLNSLLSITVPGDTRFRHIKEILHSIGVKTVIDGKSGGTNYLMIPFEVNNQKDTVFVCLSSGLLVCSTSRKTVEGAVMQMTTGDDIRSMPGFRRVHLAGGKNEDKLFIVFSNLPVLLRNYLSYEKQFIADQIANLAGTAGGDIYISESGLVLSGYTESTDSTEYLYKYKLVTPREFHAYKILPSSTALFETIILPDKDKTGIVSGPASQETKELAAALRKFTGEEITRAVIDIRDQPASGNSLIIYELGNRVLAEQVFLEKLGPNPETVYFEPDDQVRMPVYKTHFSGLTGILRPGFNPGFSETYFTFYDNFLIAGSSYATVSRLLYDNILNKTLANDLTYRDFESTLPSRACYYIYFVPSRIINYLSGVLNANILEALKSNKVSLKKIQSAGYQFTSSNGMLYNSLSVRYKEEAREESTTEWETLLDTLAAIKPFFFTNHITGAKEIFIQDLNNNTYLINTAGRVLWKVPLNERIEGNIYMVDYYKNGKYQLLFSGKNWLHLLDRNGNYVERYPVKLRSPATNSLVSFDYDNNLNYRLFIAGEDKQIYSYDKTGSVVKGWKPFRTAGLVKSDICYFKVSGKDYIVASDENSVYFLDRSGNQRLTLKDAVTRARGSAMRLTPGSDPSVICTSPDGTIQNIYFDGTVRKFHLKEFSPAHTFDIFDMNGDGFMEYIFIDKGVVYLYNHDRAELFSRDFGSINLGGPINFIFSGTDRKIGVFDVNKKLIYLINKEGKTIEGFPLRGASMFSIGKLSDKSGWHLIVGGTDRFLYNYKIDTGNN